MYSVSPANSPLLLDRAILYWVLLPIFLVMILQGVLRQFVSVLLRDEKKPDLDNLMRTQTLRRCGRLRANAAYVSFGSFNNRKQYFVKHAFTEMPKQDSPEMPGLPNTSDPTSMVSTLKQNMAMIIPNMLLLGWVNYFFAGFVLVKLPFGLTDRFRPMLQRGIALNSLDVSYVSSMSWYFLNLFGLRGLFSLLLGSDSSALDNPELAMAMQMQSMGGGGPMGQPVDYSKIFKQEQNELEIVNHEFLIQKSEQRLIAAYRKSLASH